MFSMAYPQLLILPPEKDFKQSHPAVPVLSLKLFEIYILSSKPDVVARTCCFREAKSAVHRLNVRDNLHGFYRPF
jgi:hypothetical protein